MSQSLAPSTNGPTTSSDEGWLVPDKIDHNVFMCLRENREMSKH
jgi:hypothetical protein